MAPQELYEELRPGAFAIAYRMLGSVSDAEDLVQEALLRLHRSTAPGCAPGCPQDWGASLPPIKPWLRCKQCGDLWYSSAAKAMVEDGESCLTCHGVLELLSEQAWQRRRTQH